jgi:hypothetical protein
MNDNFINKIIDLFNYNTQNCLFLISNTLPLSTLNKKDKTLKPNWRNYALKIYNNLTNIKYRNYVLDENKGKSGIYLWFNNVNNKIYIGQAKDLGNRRTGRIIRYIWPKFLKTNKKIISNIQKAFIKYGPQNFF